MNKIEKITNIFKKSLLISTLAISSSAFAHSDGHGKVSPDKIIQIALKSAKMLSFKDHGMSVGKLDTSWGNVSKEQFRVIEKGEIKDVKDSCPARNDHGHAH